MTKILDKNGNEIRLNSAEEKQVERFNAMGYQIDMTTLTQVLKKVAEQKFYITKPSDYVPVSVSEGAWSQELLQFKSYQIGGSFEDGIIDVGSDQDRLATVSAGLEPVYTKVYNWAKELHWTIPELELASKTQVWDVVSEKEKARKKNWDLGIQKVVFEGNSKLGIQGLFNLPGVAANTTLITKKIGSMTVNEFQAFMAGLLPAYRKNAEFTAYPSIFVIPEDDYNTLATAADETYPLKTRLDRIVESMKLLTGNSDFKVLPSAYASKAVNSVKNVYALYNKSEDVLRMNIPVDYTNTMANTTNGFQFENVAYGQFTGITLIRPKEIIYFTNTEDYDV